MLKTVHLASVTITIVLFLARGSWLYLLKRPLQARWIKILPHINDSVLLVSGVLLAVQLGYHPLNSSWLMVKLVCLLAYILLGMQAMKWGRGRRSGLMAWLAALLVFAFMVSVAMTRNPLGVFY